MLLIESMSFKRLNDIMYVSLAESSKFCMCRAELIWTIFHLRFLFPCMVLAAISVFLGYDDWCRLVRRCMTIMFVPIMFVPINVNIYTRDNCSYIKTLRAHPRWLCGWSVLQQMKVYSKCSSFDVQIGCAGNEMLANPKLRGVTLVVSHVFPQ